MEIFHNTGLVPFLITIAFQIICIRTLHRLFKRKIISILLYQVLAIASIASASFVGVIALEHTLPQAFEPRSGAWTVFVLSLNAVIALINGGYWKKHNIAVKG